MVSDEERISALVEEVLGRLRAGSESGGPSPEGKLTRQGSGFAEGGPLSRAAPGASGAGGRRGAFGDADTAAQAALRAQQVLVSTSLEVRKKIIEAMREVSVRNAFLLSRTAVRETGLGRVEDKVKKNLLVAEKTPGVEDLVPISWSGDRGLTLTEWAPYGVIASITPSTNPSETVINNAIGMVAAGNSVIFCPHPSAKETTLSTVELLNDAIASVSGIQNLLVSFEEPSIELAQQLMRHRGIDLLVVTGGPAVVKAAMDCGKKVIAAGPGNPPVVVDETADIEKAGADIVAGASLDNNIVCISEKEIIAVDSIADELEAAMVRAGAIELESALAPRLSSIVLREDRGGGRPSPVNRDHVGKSAGSIVSQVGLRVSEETRLAFIEVDRQHPFVWTEMLMPIVPVVRVRDVREAMDLAKKVEQGLGHTAVIHSKNIECLSEMARMMQVSIFVKNGPSFAGLGLGGEGYTSFTIASPTGEGLTSARHFTRMRRCVLVDYFRIV
ncbi:MAG: aldehyde dehydrogenase EutE [Candidatus Eiseniibacteriota bacterium]|nr:MAG: aldehyde dehydrogenase EutE [Candidatus Eisenbacteria bacterium]